MMYSFFVSVHAQPEGLVAETIELGGQTLRVLRVAPEALSATPMATSFEAARERLAKLERMFSEPDGSFVWVSPQGEPAWQVDGNLYDRNERLLFVDLKGTCPAESFDQLLTAIIGTETRPMFQLTREAVFLDEAEFLRLAGVKGQGSGVGKE